MNRWRSRIRRGTAAQWTAANPVLRLGELGGETDTGKVKMGDGVTAWSSLDYIGPGGGGGGGGGGGASWGGIGGTLSSQTDLQSALDAKAAQSEIVAARGDRANLDNRITTISNFASPNAGGIIVGQYYDNAFQGTGSAALAGAANRIDMAPFYTSARLRIDQIGISVSTLFAGSFMRCFIYNSDANGWPDGLEYEGDTDLDTSTTGYKSHTLDFTFDSGRQYWLGVRYSSATAAIRRVNISSAVNLGVNGAAGTNYFTILRRTLAFATPLPDPWNFVTGDRAASVSPPSIRMRAAALP